MNVLLSSWAKSTIRQYDSSLKNWWQFCNTNNLDPFEAKEVEILTFLTECFQRGAAYGTLNSMRSAILQVANKDASTCPLLNRFFIGAFKLRHTRPKYCATWDIELVLSELKSWGELEKLELKELTLKTTMLLPLALHTECNH